MKERKTYHKPTKDELNHRIEMATYFLARRINKGEIKRIMMARFNVTHSCVERYLHRARANLISRLGVSSEDNTVSSLAFYESIVTDPKTSVQHKMLAQEKIDWVLGVGPQFSKDSGNGSEQVVYIVREVVENRSQVLLPIEG